MLKNFTYLLIITITFSACKKDYENGLVGKWLEIEYYDTSPGSGFSKFEKVDIKDAEILEFKKDGGFIKSFAQNNNSNDCVGSYKTKSKNFLEISTNCSLVQNSIITQLSNSVLIINFQGRDTPIKRKYVAIE